MKLKRNFFLVICFLVSTNLAFSSDDIRERIAGDWASYTPPTGVVQTVSEAPANLVEVFNDGTCHYIHQGVDYNVFLNSENSWQGSRKMDSYLLGDETTHSEELCIENANKDIGYELFTAALFATLALDFEQAQGDDGSFEYVKYIGSEVRSWGERDLFKVTYKIKVRDTASILELEMTSGYEGNISFIMTNQVHPMGWIVAQSLEGTVDGQPVKFYQPIVTHIAGEEVPQF